jgi:hypothetical protein
MSSLVTLMLVIILSLSLGDLFPPEEPSAHRALSQKWCGALGLRVANGESE